MPKNNAAQRVVSILETAISHPDHHLVKQVWVDVFKIKAKKDADIVSEINICIQKLRHELHYIQKEMKKEERIEAPLYENAIDKVEKAISISNMNLPWSSLKTCLTEAVILSLRWCASLMDEESIIDKESINEFLAKIQEFEDSLQNSELADSTIDFLKELIEIMRTSVSSVSISGRKSLDEAMTTLATKIFAHQEELSNLPEYIKKPFKKCVDVIQEISSYSDKFVKLAEPIIKVLGFFS